MITRAKLFHPRVLLRLDQIAKSKPAGLLILGEKGSGRYEAAEYIASNVLEVSDPTNYPHYLVVDGLHAGIEGVRELQRKLVLKVPGDRPIRRIAVIRNFDSLGLEAQNALLKTLEEPPEDSMLLLTAADVQRVLPTIRSRVQLQRVLPLPYDIAQQEYLHASEETLRRAFLMSGGSAVLLDQIIASESDHEVVQSILLAKELLQMPKYRRVAEVEHLLKSKDTNPEVVVDGIIRVLDASYRQALEKNVSLDNLILALDRLSEALVAAEDLQNGVTAKLVLTRLFLSL